MPFAPGVAQQHGYVHACTITSIVDSACGYTDLTKAPAGSTVVTAKFKIQLTRPAMASGSRRSIRW